MTRSVIEAIWIYGYITAFCIGLIFLVAYSWERLRYNPQTAWRHREHWEQVLSQEERVTRQNKLNACYQWLLFRDKQKLNNQVILTLFFLVTVGCCIGFFFYVDQFSLGFFANHSLLIIVFFCMDTIMRIGFRHAWKQYKSHSLAIRLERTKQLKRELGEAKEALLLPLQAPFEDE